MFEKVGVPLVGIVENMSYFACPHCGERTDIFASGGGRRLAAELGVPLLGEIPLEGQAPGAGGGRDAHRAGRTGVAGRRRAARHGVLDPERAGGTIAPRAARRRLIGAALLAAGALARPAPRRSRPARRRTHPRGSGAHLRRPVRFRRGLFRASQRRLPARAAGPRAGGVRVDLGGAARDDDAHRTAAIDSALNDAIDRASASLDSAQADSRGSTRCSWLGTALGYRARQAELRGQLLARLARRARHAANPRPRARARFHARGLPPAARPVRLRGREERRAGAPGGPHRRPGRRRRRARMARVRRAGEAGRSRGPEAQWVYANMLERPGARRHGVHQPGAAHRHGPRGPLPRQPGVPPVSGDAIGHTVTEPARRTSDITAGPLAPAVLRRWRCRPSGPRCSAQFLLVDISWVGPHPGVHALAAVSTAAASPCGCSPRSVNDRRRPDRGRGAPPREGAHGHAAVAAGSTLAVALAAGALVAVGGHAVVDVLFRIMETPAPVTALGDSTWAPTCSAPRWCSGASPSRPRSAPPATRARRWRAGRFRLVNPRSTHC